jgi:hypothetical protein
VVAPATDQIRSQSVPNFSNPPPPSSDLNRGKRVQATENTSIITATTITTITITTEPGIRDDHVSLLPVECRAPFCDLKWKHAKTDESSTEKLSNVDSQRITNRFKFII